jgi:hypothetical protein
MKRTALLTAAAGTALAAAGIALRIRRSAATDPVPAEDPDQWGDLPCPPPGKGVGQLHDWLASGDRAANAALYRIALCRMSSDRRTRDHVVRQTEAGRTKKEIIRLLKRAIAREIFRCLTTTVAVPGIADLRPLRQAKNITLTAVAGHFGVWPATISTLERGIRRDDDLANAYREWLTAA